MNEEIFHLGIKALIRNNHGDILLLKVNRNLLKKTKGFDGEEYWDIPGGRIQKDATPEDTLKREIQEEIGNIELSNIKNIAMFLSNIRIPINEKEHIGLVLSVYSCEIPQDASIALSEEHTAYDWFSPVEAAKLLSFKYPKEFTKVVNSL
jgi:8-oxo-dGTP pyrophosphatase MutT (NUDIX family)